MTGHQPELAWYVSELGSAAPAAPPSCRVIYLADGDAIALGRTLRALETAPAILGLSLDYPDGQDPRRTGAAAPDIELEDALLARLAAFSAIARRWGRRLVTVACHGALALDVADDERSTQVIARTLQRYDPDLSLAVPAGHRGVAVAHHCGIKVLREAWMNLDDCQPSSLSATAGNDTCRVDRYRLYRDTAIRNE